MECNENPLIESHLWFRRKPQKTAAQKRLEEFDHVQETGTLPERIAYNADLMESMHKEGE